MPDSTSRIDSMTARTESMARMASFTRVEPRRRPDRRTDARGVVIGPWSDSVKRATALMRAAHQR